MHNYGTWDDKSFEQVDDAASLIGRILAKWGRISVTQVKEKFGTVRVYCHFGWDCFHGIVWPRHHWIPTWWPYELDLAISRLLPLINRVVIPYQEWIYRLTYKRAVTKYPHLWLEILVDADYGKLLDGIAGYRHADYWKEI